MKILTDLHDRDIFEEYIEREIDYIYRPTVKGIIINNENKVALLKARGHYLLPGGGVEEGESNEEALKREIMEELGCEIADLNLIVTSKQYRAKKAKCYEIYFYIANVIGYIGAPTTTQADELEGIEIEWRSREEVYKILESQKDAVDTNEYAYCFNTRSHFGAYEYYFNLQKSSRL